MTDVTLIPDDITRRYPWIYPPINCDPFVLIGPAAPQNLNPGASLNLIVRADVARGKMGRVQAFGIATSDFTNTQWTFLVRGAPRAPVTALTGNYGTISAPEPLPGVGVILVSGDDFIVQATNIGVAIINGVQARVQGYEWVIV